MLFSLLPFDIRHLLLPLRRRTRSETRAIVISVAAAGRRPSRRARRSRPLSALVRSRERPRADAEAARGVRRGGRVRCRPTAGGGDGLADAASPRRNARPPELRTSARRALRRRRQRSGTLTFAPRTPLRLRCFLSERKQEFFDSTLTSM